MAVVVEGLETLIQQGPMPDAQWDQVRREEAKRVDAEIRRHPNAVVTDFVSGNFKRSWRSGELPNTARFGSDYDYWGAVVADAVSIWNQYASSLVPGYHDYIAEGKNKWPKHFSLDEYARAGISVWQNGQRSSPGAQFKGPVVDVGPNADFAIFLEQPGPHFRVFKGQGVVRALADTLQQRWDGIHRVFFATTKTGGRIRPFVRIRNRHAR